MTASREPQGKLIRENESPIWRSAGAWPKDLDRDRFLKAMRDGYVRQIAERSFSK